MAYKHYQLRETCPNPAGTPYRDLTEEQIDRNLDYVTEEMKHCVEKRILPLLLENNAGNVHRTAMQLATIASFAVYMFMKDNRAEGQANNLSIYSELEACMVGAVNRMSDTSLAKALGVPDELIKSGAVKIIHL